MADISRDDESRTSDRFLEGDVEAVGLVDGWIDAVLHEQFQSLRSDWDDLRQEVRVRVLRNLQGQRFEGRSALRTYVHSIARNTCVDAARRAARERGADSLDAQPDPALPGTAQTALSRELLEKILASLDPDERELVRLAFFEERSYFEIAEMLGVPTGTVKSRMARCKARLIAARKRLLQPRRSS